ncbi:group 1 truncated hemoglobin [Pleionea sp. CnH1-48]|uniref:group I truncated hemoglobin n=1 Tax=Pleionea sp. CnH1-48 TaxID=2954494 RepID=UPI0020968882|nr:group 1 truncated hemoglobin [Pleionea sp. CnH1-48]MCO7223117.1 group 1 truncated hemoglobin [Pleionea sp. CnH1-48]
MFTQPSIFTRIGGHSAVEAAVNSFYPKIMESRILRRFFNGISSEEQIQKVRFFFIQAMGGPNVYTSFDIRAAHAPLLKKGLSDEHIDEFLRLMRETLEELSIPDVLIEEFVELADSFRDDILNR